METEEYKELRHEWTNRVNSSNNEFDRLFKLCENNLVKLQLTYDKLRYFRPVPDTKEELELMLKL